MARYEVCEVARSRGGARLVRVLASTSSRSHARRLAQRIARDEGLDAPSVQVFDTASRLWMADRH